MLIRFVCLSELISRFWMFASTAGRQLARFRADDSGTTAIEYGMIAAGVAVCIAGTVWNVGTTIKATFYDKLASMFP